MGAVGGSQQRQDGSKAATMKTERGGRGVAVAGAAAARRKPMNLKVDVANLDSSSPHPFSTSPIEKHVVETPVESESKPRRKSSSSFLQPDRLVSELTVKTGAELKVKTGNRSSSVTVSDSPKSARSVRSIRGSFDTPRNESPSPHFGRTGLKPLELNRGNRNGPRSRRSESVVSKQSQSEFETFYDSLPTWESPESPRLEAHGLELPKLELSYEGKPAPAPAHLRLRTGSSLPLSEPKRRSVSERDPAPSLEPVKGGGVISPALLKLQATSALLGNPSTAPSGHGKSMREKLRSASSRRSGSVSQGDGDPRAVHSFQGLPSVISHSEPLKAPKFEGEEAKDYVKPAGLLRRMLHWGASKLGKKSSKGSSGSRNNGKETAQQVEPKSEAASRIVAQPEAEREIEVTDRGVAKLDANDGTCSPRDSVSSAGTAFSDVSSKSHGPRKHKKHVKSEVVKSKLWLLRVHQKLQGRPSNKDSGDESDGNVLPITRGATFHGHTDASSKTVDKEILSASARYNSEKKSISNLVGNHRRNSTWDAGKLNSSADFLFSPKHKLPKSEAGLFSPKQKLHKSDAQGLLTPPRRLTGDTTDFQRRRRPTSLTTDVIRNASRSPSPSPRNPSRVAPDQTAPPGEDHSRDATRRSPKNRGAPLSTAPAAGTFLQTAALILASPDAPKKQQDPSPPNSSAPNHSDSRARTESATPPISPTSHQSSFKGFVGFNSPHPLPIRVSTTEGSPRSPIYPAGSPRGRLSKSPGRNASEGPPSTPTSPGVLAPSPGWSGVQSSPSSSGIFAASPGWIEVQRSPRSPSGAAPGTGFQIPRTGNNTSSQTSSPRLPHARSHGSRAGEQLLLEDISFTNLVKRPGATSSASRGGQAREPKSAGTEAERDGPEKQNASGASPQPPLSFEQVVAGRNCSPPTDNTLMKFFFKCREIEHLNKFLALQKKRFLESFSTESDKSFHMILSEDGQGLSSMISTLCTAWLLENTMASATLKWHPIPVMNMCQKEMWQHRDAAWLFHVCGIDPSALLFLDEVTSTAEMVIAGRVKRAVTGQDILQTKDEVASSCTIVSEKFRQEAPKLLQARYMKTLLLAGILVDTKNLSIGSTRDKQQATILLVGAGSLGRNGFYKHLVNIRDENYVTPFIREIYGDSKALTVEHSAAKGPGVEQRSKPMSRPTSIISPEEPPPKPTPKPTPKPIRDNTEPESSRTAPHASSAPQARAPQNSKLSFSLRRLRTRPSAGQQ